MRETLSIHVYAQHTFVTVHENTTIDENHEKHTPSL